MAEKSDQKIAEMLANLKVYQEEMRTQNEALIATQQTVEETRDRYAELYDKAPVGYLTMDCNGVIEQSNSAVTGMLLTRKEALIRRPLLVFVHSQDRPFFLNHLLRVKNTGTSTRTELRLRRGDRSYVYVELVTVHVARRAGIGDRYLTTIIDVSERRIAEQQRRVAEDEQQAAVGREEAANVANEAKDRFLAVLSHELRTPLTPILAAVCALEASELSPQLASVVEMIRRNVEMEGRLIDDLLDVTRIARSKLRLTFETLDAHQLIQETAKMVSGELQEQNLTLSLHLDARCHYIRADSARFRQILWNLLTNAIKFTPEQGRVTIRTCDQAVELAGPVVQDNAASALRGEGILLEVQDTGVGIAAEVLPKLFRPFEQGESDRPGLGLGLSIVRGLVDAHGGSIEGWSEGPGRGATFRMQFAAVPAEVGVREEQREPRAVFSAASQPLRILLVEDHPDTSQIMTRLLGAEGHEVTQASSRGEALVLAKQPFDLVISDIGLPDGSGLELMQELRSRDLQMPAVALSGYGTDEDVERSRRAGLNEHLTKPVDIRNLLEVVGRLTPEMAH